MIVKLTKIPFTLVGDPKQWKTETHRVPNVCKMHGAERVLRVNYGYVDHKGTGVRKSAWCLMRESIYRGLCDGLLKAYPSDNEAGFIVMDSVMRLAIPRMTAPNGRIIY